MAGKRKTGTEHGGASGGHKRRESRAAGRVAVRREAAAPGPLTADTSAEGVRERIDTALAEALRMREAIEQRIERRLTQPLHERDTSAAKRTVRTLPRAPSP